MDGSPAGRAGMYSPCSSSQRQMDADSLLDLRHFFFRQFADKLNKAAFIDGSDLVGFTFGIFGKIGCPFEQERFKRICFLCVFGCQRDNADCAGVQIVLVIRNNETGLVLEISRPTVGSRAAR